MTIPIAILAACAGALALTATLVYAGEPIPGVDVEIPCNPKTGWGCPIAFKGKADPKRPAANEKTFLDGDASFGRGSGGQARRGKITDNDSPRPTDRIFLAPGPDGAPQRR